MREIVYTLLLIVLILGLVARIVWWIGGIYLGGRSICRTVHKNLSHWWERAGKLLAYMPEDLSVPGFFFTLIWPCLICLNILLLSQVFELFFPGGKRIPLPWVGSYAIFPLIMAILYAIAQTSFGIVYKRSKSKTEKFGYGAIIAVTIVVEMGLATYRAWLLATGEEVISPTLWDMVMIRGGPILAGFLGFIVPLGEIITGTFAFGEFIEPIIKAFLHWFGGGIITLWCAAAWWLFGFHPLLPPLPTSVKNLKKKANNLKKKVNRLQNETGKLQEEAMKLDNTPGSFDVLKQEITKLKNDAEDMNQDWVKQEKIVEDDIEKAKEPRKLDELKRKIREQKKIKMPEKSQEIEIKAESYDKEIKEVCRDIRKWVKTAAICQNWFPKIRNRANNLQQDSSPLKNWASEIDMVLQGHMPNPQNFLIPPQISELEELLTKANGPDSLEEKLGALQIVAECKRVTAEPANIGNNLEGIAKTLNQIEEKIPNSIPASPSKQDEKILRATALQIEDSMIEYKNDNIHQLRKLKWECGVKKCQLTRKPWWLRFYLNLIKRKEAN